MLCPECGSEVGETLKLCERCARKRIQLSDFAKMPGVMESNSGLGQGSDFRGGRGESGGGLRTMLMATGVVTFVCSLILGYVFFGGPGRETLDNSRAMISALLCQTNLLGQVEDYLALQTTSNDAAVKSKGKLALATLDSMLPRYHIQKRDYDRVRGLWSSRRERFEASVFDAARQACGFNVEDQGRVMRVVEWLLTADADKI